jgi:hypothetical protein
MYNLPNFVHTHFDKSADELGDIEKRVLKKAHERKIISTDVNAALLAEASIGQRLADDIARIGGSWGFIISFLLFLTVWTVINTILLATRAFDPYPFIFLNLLLSMIAAIQAPIDVAEPPDRARSLRGGQGLRSQSQGGTRSPVSASEDRLAGSHRAVFAARGDIPPGDRIGGKGLTGAENQSDGPAVSRPGALCRYCGRPSAIS